MRTTRWIAAVLGVAVLIFVAVFIGAGLGLIGPAQAPTDGLTPAATFSDSLAEGRIDGRVYVLGDRDISLEIQFTPGADSTVPADMRPDVSFAMAGMQMDGRDPPLELVKPGSWRSSLKLPMAGRWIVSVGFGEEFAEVEFDAD